MAAREAPLPQSSAERHVGLLLLLVSALAFSSAGLFTKAVTASAWEVVFWRGLFAALATASFAASRLGLRGAWRLEILAMGPPGLAVAVVGGIGSACFISAFKLTTVANVTLIFAGAPLAAALIAWVWAGERPSRLLFLGCALALAGVAVIAGGSLATDRLAGDVLALCMTVAMAFVIAVYRRFPRTPSAGPMVLSSLLLLGPALLLSAPFSVPWGEIGLLALFGLSFAVASVTLLEGARRLSAGEAGLLSNLELLLAPFLAWLLLGERVPSATWSGGALVLLAVLIPLVSGRSGLAER